MRAAHTCMKPQAAPASYLSFGAFSEFAESCHHWPSERVWVESCSPPVGAIADPGGVVAVRAGSSSLLGAAVHRPTESSRTRVAFREQQLARSTERFSTW